MTPRRNRRLPVGAALGRRLRDRFAGDALDLADALGVLTQRVPMRPRTLIFLPRTTRGGFGVAMLPRVTTLATNHGMLAAAVALHLDTRVGDPPFVYAAGVPLFDAARADRARLFALAFLGETATRRTA